MTHPISFELAKSLKEKGFKDECRGYWGYDSYFKERNVTYPRTKFSQWYRNEILAPTIAEVVMWLYDKHGIWIYLLPSEDNKDVFKPFFRGKIIVDQHLTKFYRSPTEAYEAGIKHVLENLI